MPDGGDNMDRPSGAGLAMPPDAHFLTLISKVEHQFSLSLDRVLRAEGITFRQFVALARVSHAPGLSIADLARALLTSPQNAATLVSRLEALGYLVCKRAKRGRSATLDLTSSGLDYLRRVEAVALAAEERSLSVLSAQERALAFEILGRLLTHLQNTDDDVWPG